MDTPSPTPDDSPEPIPAGESYAPIAFQNSGRLYLEEGAILPTETCIRCGRPSQKAIRKSLRNAKNPLTWYGKTKKIEIGLCKKNLENWNIAVAITYSVLVLGILLLGLGIFSRSPSLMIVGSAILLVSGIFRARTPVQSTQPKANPVEILGACETYTNQFPVVEFEVPETEEEPVP